VGKVQALAKQEKRIVANCLRKLEKRDVFVMESVLQELNQDVGVFWMRARRWSKPLLFNSFMRNSIFVRTMCRSLNVSGSEKYTRLRSKAVPRVVKAFIRVEIASFLCK
jgi:hypothetical protein